MTFFFFFVRQSNVMTTPAKIQNPPAVAVRVNTLSQEEIPPRIWLESIHTTAVPTTAVCTNYCCLYCCILSSGGMVWYDTIDLWDSSTTVVARYYCCCILCMVYAGTHDD